MSKPALNNSVGLADSRRDRILNANLRQQIFVLAIPTLTQQFLTFCVAMFDTWLAGQIDAPSTSAIGVSAYVGWLAALLVSTVSIGTTAMVARHCGAKETASANRVMGVSLLVGQVLCVCMSAVLFVAAPYFVRLFNLNGQTGGIALNYLRFDAIGHLLTGVTVVGTAALRGSGDMKRPLAVLGTISVLNMIASVCCVYGVGPGRGLDVPYAVVPVMGVYGIAAGTVSARLIGGLLMVLVLLRGNGILKLQLVLLKPDREIIKRLFDLGRFAGADSLIHWVGQFGFLMIIKRVVIPGVHDDAVFAAHIVGIQVEAITYLPAMAWGSAAATLIGQSLGAGKLKRAYKAGVEASLQCSLLALFVSFVFYVGATTIYEIMHKDPQVVAVGVPAFRAMSWFQIPLVVFLVLKSALQGAGDTRWPMVATVLGIFCWRIPGAWFLGVYLQWGLLGAWCGMFADIIFRSLVVGRRYLTGKWVTTKV